jgi:hypothetical protein
LPSPALRHARPAPRQERLLYNLGGAQGGQFSPVEIEPDGNLLAIDNKAVFTIASLISALVKVADMAPTALISPGGSGCAPRRLMLNGSPFSEPVPAREPLNSRSPADRLQ